MDDHAVQVPTEHLLNEARQELRAALRFTNVIDQLLLHVSAVYFQVFVPNLRTVKWDLLQC